MAQANDVMARVVAVYEASHLTLAEIGRRMGYPPAHADSAVWHFLFSQSDPAVSTLIRYADAMGVSPGRLVGPGRKSGLRGGSRTA